MVLKRYSETGIAATNDASHIRLVASDVQSTSSWFLSFEDEAADTSDTTVVYESPADVSMFNHHEFSIYQAPGTGTVEVLVSHDGITYETTPIQVVDRSLVKNANPGSLNALSAIGNYYFDGKFKMWKLANASATSVVTKVRGSHSVV